jgi:hypothetical protein
MAETITKTKAVTKPKAPATAKAPAPKKTVAETIAAAPSHEEIAALAQQYWAERGWTEGHAEQDWLRAERELSKMAS